MVQKGESEMNAEQKERIKKEALEKIYAVVQIDCKHEWYEFEGVGDVICEICEVRKNDVEAIDLAIEKVSEEKDRELSCKLHNQPYLYCIVCLGDNVKEARANEREKCEKETTKLILKIGELGLKVDKMEKEKSEENRRLSDKIPEMMRIHGNAIANELLSEIEKFRDDVKNEKIKFIELGCGKCYNPNHTKAPYNCSCYCHKAEIINSLLEELKKRYGVEK
jgi:hypothetical protein